jgi:aryl-alcohol dehydrogenase-like predicted oxidoreductase
MERGPERNGVLQACEELGIGFVPWGPVGMGYLTGKMDAGTELDPKTDLRTGFDRFSSENLAANMPVVNC